MTAGKEKRVEFSQTGERKQMLIYYTIQHKPSGGFIPYKPTRGSTAEPSVLSPPRLFPTKKSAQGFLSAWLQGKWAHRGFETLDGWDYEWSPKKVESRKKEDMEIVEAHVELPC